MSTRRPGGHYDATCSARRERAAEDRVQVLKRLPTALTLSSALRCAQPVPQRKTKGRVDLGGGSTGIWSFVSAATA